MKVCIDLCITEVCMYGMYRSVYLRKILYLCSVNEIIKVKHMDLYNLK